jgi:hypothetical protein
MGMKSGIPAQKDSLTVSYKTKCAFTISPDNCTFGHLSQRSECYAYTKSLKKIFLTALFVTAKK